MSFRTRSTRTVALAVAAVLALAACTAAEPERPVDLVVKTSDPDAALTILGEATDREASVAASRELFDASPMVVIAPSGDAEAQELSARAAVALGVPLLIGPGDESPTDAPTTNAPESSSAPENSGSPDKPKIPKNVDNPKTEDDPSKVAPPPSSGDTNAEKGAKDPKNTKAPKDAGKAADKTLTAELKRLGASAALVVGDVSDLAQDADSAVEVTRVKATASAIAEATGVKLSKQTADPDGFAAGVAALDPPKAGSHTPPADGIPHPKPATPLTDTLALAVDGVLQLGPIATARAAGVPVHLLPEGIANPQAQASAIDALHASTATKTLAIGTAFAVEPALDWKIRSARSGLKLPGGGQVLFPAHQFVALYGTPSTSVLGVLGEQDAAGAVQRARDHAAPYQALTDKTVVPMFEIIATVAAAGAGKDGNYSNELGADTLRPWVDAAAAAGLYVVIDLQPGRTDFLTQAKQYQSLLELPNVGLALDPEWRLGPDQVPLRQIGTVSAAEVNSVTTWLADLTNEKGLPQKMLVLHQFRPSMISDRLSLDLSRPEIAVLIHADGQGGQGDKQATWANLHRDAPAGIHWGWKNFYDEDLPMLTPEQTMSAVSPAPDLVTYQ